MAITHQSFDWDWLAAEREFRRELEANAGNAEARALFGLFQLGLGRHDAALREVRGAVDSDPLSPIAHHMLALVLLGLGRSEDAIPTSRHGVELAGGFTHASWSLGIGLSLTQQHDEAVAVLREALNLAPSDHLTLAFAGWACGRAGLGKEAIDIAKQLEERCKGFAGYFVALVCLGLDDHEGAFSWLARGCDERSGLMFNLPSFIVWKPLRADSRFQALLRKMNFHRILTAYSESKDHRKSNRTLKEKKRKDVEFEIGTGERDDVMTIHDLADEFGVSRDRAVKIVRRLEGDLEINRLPARAARSGQKIIAYKRSDGRNIVVAHQERLSKKDARRKAKEMRKIDRERIPRPRPPGSKTELWYLIQMSPTDDQFKIGWTSDIEERVRSYKTANPRLHVMKKWACNRERDNAAMKHLFQFDAIERIGKEVFRTKDINRVITRLDDFF